MEDSGHCPYCGGNVVTIGRDEAARHEDWIYADGQVGPRDMIRQCVSDGCGGIHAFNSTGTISPIGKTKRAFVAVL